MAVKYHPDMVATLGEDVQTAAEDKFKAVSQVYYADMRFLTIDSPQHSFAKQMQGEPMSDYLTSHLMRQNLTENLQSVKF